MDLEKAKNTQGVCRRYQYTIVRANGKYAKLSPGAFRLPPEPRVYSGVGAPPSLAGLFSMDGEVKSAGYLSK